MDRDIFLTQPIFYLLQDDCIDLYLSLYLYLPGEPVAYNKGLLWLISGLL